MDSYTIIAGHDRQEMTISLDIQETSEGFRTCRAFRRQHGSIGVHCQKQWAGYKPFYDSVDLAAAIDRYPDVVFVHPGAVAHGGWMFFRLGTETDQCSGGLVRGHTEHPEFLSADWSRSAWDHWFGEMK